jgi:hypothetical protein
VKVRDRAWQWLRADPDGDGSRLHLFAIDERKNSDRVTGPTRRIYWRGFAHFRVPLNPVCRTLGCAWYEADAYTLPPRLFGLLDLSRPYRVAYDVAQQERREREAQNRAGRPGNVRASWRLCARCHRRERTERMPAASGDWRDDKIVRVAGVPGPKRGEAKLEIVSQRPRLEFGLGVEVDQQGEPGLKVDLHLPFITIYAGLGGPVDHAVNLLAPRLGEERRLGFRTYRDSTGDVVVTWDLWSAEVLQERVTPKWRKGYVDVNRKVLGPWQRVEGESETADLLIPMPEGTYPATATVTRITRFRKRTPWRSTVSWSLDVKCPVGIPEPGNDDSDFYDGEDATYGVSTGLTYGHAWKSEAIGTMVAAVMRDRIRHSSRGVDWRPTRGPYGTETLAQQQREAEHREAEIVEDPAALPAGALAAVNPDTATARQGLADRLRRSTRIGDLTVTNPEPQDSAESVQAALDRLGFGKP